MYRMSDLPPLPVSYSSEFLSVVHRLLHCDVTLRCSVEEARGIFAGLPDHSCQAETVLTYHSRTETERVSRALEISDQSLNYLYATLKQLEKSVAHLVSGFQQLTVENSQVNSITTSQLKLMVDSLQPQIQPTLHTILLSRAKSLVDFQSKRLWDEYWVLERQQDIQAPLLVSRNCKSKFCPFI